jgi:hypothetical protein
VEDGSLWAKPVSSSPTMPKFEEMPMLTCARRHLSGPVRLADEGVLLNYMSGFSWRAPGRPRSRRRRYTTTVQSRDAAEAQQGAGSGIINLSLSNHRSPLWPSIGVPISEHAINLSYMSLFAENAPVLLCLPYPDHSSFLVWKSSSATFAMLYCSCYAAPHAEMPFRR